MPVAPTLLIVDDDAGFARSAACIARAEGFEAILAADLEQARRRLDEQTFDLALVDLGLPDGSGMDLLRRLEEADTRVVVVTGSPSIETAVQAVRSPCADYLVKPIEPAQYTALLRSVAQARGRDEDAERERFGLVGKSSALAELLRQIRLVGPTDASVLIQGESGVGKELVARAIHQASGRPGPFVAVNCGAVSAELLGSQLFGHERGSFTGATGRHVGYFEQAAGGTLFLDEITEMPTHLQAHLLRVLEERAVRRLGGDSEIAVDTRIVAATNRPTREAVADGSFRNDVYYRLGEFPLPIPPLRERPEDIAPLAWLFLARLNERHGTRKQFTPTALQQLQRYPWPGNVRELRNVVGRAYISARGDSIREPLRDVRWGQAMPETAGSFTVTVGMSFEEVERRLLSKTLAFYNHDKTRTARALGVSVKTIYNRLHRGVDPA
ncbi:sigma-54-dependent transcriptional regulator [Pseudomarimonas salicorniae]|uniref:Sigma-54 dependent transcriptional regulator n=1 Tax=Pseudomarimonas salicorniae TaxID=2933270 RepID=A0ABT0GLK9_9GAMM|nr:sigma-54 dependent transcriptional regulator [Lysobacter sp. CAU 1642]MCK7595247.1 sigma-54 dependent transcriptional regulator [Lysobacter sp. CAU 1642]